MNMPMLTDIESIFVFVTKFPILLPNEETFLYHPALNTYILIHTYLRRKRA